MSISGQQPINIGQPNSPANSDSLYCAFNTVQTNFTCLFSAASPITTISAGNGIVISNSSASAYTICNGGVTCLVAGTGVTLSAATGCITIGSTGGGNGGSGTVTSVGVCSSTLAITNSPITANGNIGVGLCTISGVSGCYRNPNVTVDSYGRVTAISNGNSTGTVTSVAIASGNGIAVSGGPILSNGTLCVCNTGVTSIVAGTGICINSSNGAVTITATGGGGGGSGTVTRVGVCSNTLTVTGSPVTTSGNICVELPGNLCVSNVCATTLTSNILNVNISNAAANTGVTISSANANSCGITFRQSRGTISAPVCSNVGDVMLNLQTRAYTGYGCYQCSGGMRISVAACTNSPTLPAANALVESNVTIYSTGIPTGNIGVQYPMVLSHTGNLCVPGRVQSQVISSLCAGIPSFLSIRSRGTDTGNLAILCIGDSIARTVGYGYTGNGTTPWITGANISRAGWTEFRVASLPTASGNQIPSEFIITTINTTNGCNQLIYTSTGNLEMTGSYLGGAVSVSGNVTASLVTGTLTTALQPNITCVGTLANLSVTGTATAATLAGNLSTAAQPNITSVGTLSTLSVSGNATIGNIITGGVLSATGNVRGGNVNTAGNVSATGIVAATGNISGGNVTTVGAISATGNITVGGFQTTLTPTANTIATVAATIPIIVGGNTYYIMLAQ